MKNGDKKRDKRIKELEDQIRRLDTDKSLLKLEIEVLRRQKDGQTDITEPSSSYNKFLCCIHKGQLDCMTFANPDKDPEAMQKAEGRLRLLQARDGEPTTYLALIVGVAR